MKNWIEKHGKKCLACEKSGHIAKDCRSRKLPIDKLSDDNPRKIAAEKKPNHGEKTYNNSKTDTSKAASVYVTQPLSAFYSHPSSATFTYIVDTGAAGLSYVPNECGMDPRTIKTFGKPISIAGIGGTDVATKGGTVYARVKAYNGTKLTKYVIRFDAAVLPSLNSTGYGLISPQSLIYDTGLYLYRKEKVSEQHFIPGLKRNSHVSEPYEHKAIPSAKSSLCKFLRFTPIQVPNSKETLRSTFEIHSSQKHAVRHTNNTRTVSSKDVYVS